VIICAGRNFPGTLLSYKSSCILPASRHHTRTSPATGSSLYLSNADLSGRPVHRLKYMSTLAIDSAHPRPSLWTDTFDHPVWQFPANLAQTSRLLYTASQTTVAEKAPGAQPPSEAKRRSSPSAYLDYPKARSRASSPLGTPAKQRRLYSSGAMSNRQPTFIRSRLRYWQATGWCHSDMAVDLRYVAKRLRQEVGWMRKLFYIHLCSSKGALH
jgi:hypothetical protein